MNRPVPVESASAIIDAGIKELGDWRGKTRKWAQSHTRQIRRSSKSGRGVKATSPGTPVLSHGGMVCTGETYKNVAQMTFAKGAALQWIHISSNIET
jgi:hypothetical protein